MNKKRFLNKYFILPLFLLGIGSIFFYPKISLATEYPLYSQGNNDHEFTLGAGSSPANYSFNQFLGNGLSGTIDQICVYTRSQTNIRFGFYKSNTGYPDLGTTLYNGSGDDAPGNSKVKYCNSFNDITLDPTKFYALQFQQYDGGLSTAFYGSVANSWSDTVNNLYGGSSGNLNGDAYFELNSPNSPPNSISITSPLNSTSSSNLQPAPVSFLSTFNLPNTSSTAFEILVKYSTSSDFSSQIFTGYAFLNLSNPISSSTDISISTAWTSWTTDDWYAYENLYNIQDPWNSVFLASSSIIHFPVSTTFIYWGQEYPTNVTSSYVNAENTTTTLSCSGGNWIADTLCWLFIPDQQSLAEFYDKYVSSVILSMPPFSFLSDVRTEIVQNLSASSTLAASSTPTVYIQTNFGHGSTTLTIFDLNKTKLYFDSGSHPWTAFRNIISVWLWLFLVDYIILRIRSLQGKI